MMNEVFLDATHIIALTSATDQHHDAARRWQHHLEEQRARFVTTQAILLEVGNALAGHRFRRAAVTIITALEQDPTVQVVPLTADLFAQGFRLFAERPDKEWGLVDCISFAVMGERGLRAALTADAHFRQAGFRTLLLEPLP